MSVEIHGFVANGLDRLRDLFASNFEREDGFRELGSSLAVFQGEELIVHLYGGYRDAEHSIAWTADTLVNIWSASKGVTGLAMAVLVDRGLVDYAAPVARYWPEFAQNGKSGITVSHVLSHQAGLPGFDDPTTVEDFYDWEKVTTRLAKQAPMWEPGTKTCYHAQTVGFLAGEIIRRVSGMSLGQFLAKEVAGPLDAEVFFGVPQQEEHRVAPMHPAPPEPPMPFDELGPEVLIAATNPVMTPDTPNNRAWRAAEIPAGNGHATALGMARLYAMPANGGTFEGVTLLRPQTIAAMNTVQSDHVDMLNGVPMNWCNGVFNSQRFGPNPRAFGHSGWGGSFGAADPENRISMGYVVNQMGARSLEGDARGNGLSHMLYECLGLT